MCKKLFLTAILTVFGFLQTTHSSWAAGADQHPPQTENHQASNPKKEHPNNLSVSMHGAYLVAIIYKDCDGNMNRDPVGAGSTINRCVAPNTPFYAVEASDAGNIALSLYTNNGKSISKSIFMKEDGVTMDCGGSPFLFNMKCDWTTPFKPQ